MLRIIQTLLLFCLLAPAAGSAREIVVLGLFRDKAMVEVDGRRYTLSVGDTVDGEVTLISSNSREAVLEIDGVVSSYPLGVHIGGKFKGPAARQTVTVAPDNNGMFWVNGTINRFQTRFIVDTGATYISMNKHQARRLGLDYKLSGEKSVSMTAAGPDTVYLLELDIVTVGSIQARNVMAAIHDADYPEYILLGNSFLNLVSLKRQGQLLELSVR